MVSARPFVAAAAISGLVAATVVFASPAWASDCRVQAASPIYSGGTVTFSGFAVCPVNHPGKAMRVQVRLKEQRRWSPDRTIATSYWRERPGNGRHYISDFRYCSLINGRDKNLYSVIVAVQTDGSSAASDRSQAWEACGD